MGVVNQPTRTCTKCQQAKTLSEFSRRGRKSDALKSTCKKCTAQARRDHYLANREHERATNRRWIEQNQERRADYNKEYQASDGAKASKARSYRKNLEANRAKKRQWHKDNPEQTAANKRRWNAENAERLAVGRRVKYLADVEASRRAAREWAKAHPEQRAYNQRRREARKRGHQSSLDPAFADYLVILKLDPCSYCGGVTEAGDHIVPLARGGEHAWENLTASCRSCNSRKRATSLLVHLLRR